MIKWALCMPLAICMFFVGILALGEETPVSLSVYLYDPCGGCEGVRPGCGECDIEIAVSNRIGNMLRNGLNEGWVKLQLYNVLDEAADERYKQELARFGAAGHENRFPAFIVGEAPEAIFFSGEDGYAMLGQAVEMVRGYKNFRASFLQRDDKAGDNESEPEEPPEVVTLPFSDKPADVRPGDSVIVYFYKPACPYCLELKALIQGLPREITLPDGTRSSVRLIGLNKNDPAEMAVVQAYYEGMEIPEDRQFVPMLLIGDRDLFLYEEIVPGLLPALLQGDGTKTDMEPFERND